jgi:hypothetical protein
MKSKKIKPIPGHLMPVYMPKIKVRDSYHKPVATKHRLQVVIITVFLLGTILKVPKEK